MDLKFGFPSPDLFQISNQRTLGTSEKEILDSIGNVSRYVIDEEEKARQRLMEEASDQITDKIWRSFGILKYARVLTSEEVMNLLSAVRLGVAMKVFDLLDIPLINQMLLLSQPAHLQKFFDEDMDQDRRDYIRAQMIREKIRTFKPKREQNS